MSRDRKQLTDKELAAIVKGLQTQGYITVDGTQVTYATPAGDA